MRTASLCPRGINSRTWIRLLESPTLTVSPGFELPDGNGDVVGGVNTMNGVPDGANERALHALQYFPQETGVI